MARILHRLARERYRAFVVASPRDRSGVTPVLFAIAAAVVAAFGPAVRFGFVYDDHWTVESNRALDGRLVPLLSSLLVGRGTAAGVPDSTRPTMVASEWLDRRLFGLDPAGHHLHSLVLYFAVCVLATVAVFAIVRRVRAAVIGGLLFAVWPVHAEVVAAINYREDLEAAAAVFGLIAWLFLPRGRGSREHRAWAAALTAIGLLGKENAIVVFPLAALIATIRFSASDWFRARRGSLGALAIPAALWVLWRSWLRINGRDDVPLSLEHRGIADRIFRTARYAVRATADGVLPIRWSPEYAPPGPASALWLLPLAGLVGLVLMLSKRRRSRSVAAAIGVSLVAPLATSPLLSPINEWADRYVFIGSFGGALLWGLLADRATARLTKRTSTAAVAVSLLPLVIVCHRAVAPFRSDADLWRIATERAPTSPRAFAGLARVRRLSGDLDGADRAVERALALDPKSFMARVTRVYNLLARGNVASAQGEIREITALGGNNHRGMRRAIRCAALPPGEAAACIDQQ
jgi:hypothetical protein